MKRATRNEEMMRLAENMYVMIEKTKMMNKQLLQKHSS